MHLLKKIQCFFKKVNLLKQTYIPSLRDWALRPKGQTINSNLSGMVILYNSIKKFKIVFFCLIFTP